MIVKSGKYRGQKIQYDDGVGVCIWENWPDEEAVKVENVDFENKEVEGGGLCFDFSGDSLPDVLNVLQLLKGAEPDPYVRDEKYEAFLKEKEEFENRWYYKLWDIFDDISIQIRPFEWRCKTWLISNETFCKGKVLLKIVKGFHFGPLVITW